MALDLAAICKCVLVPLALVVLACCGLAQAQPLEDISLEFQREGVVATIRLSGPVQYLRHFPESHGKTLEIYYNRVQDATSTEPWVDGETRSSPPSSLIPAFTVTTRDQATKPKLVVEFSREAEFSVSIGRDNRSLLITIQPDRRPTSKVALPLLPTVKPVAEPAPGTVLKPEEQTALQTNKDAYALMVQARDALAANNNEAAVEALNRLLLLPPNDYTRDGQEWVGVARERAGQPDRAKVEYDLYLRLYPEGDGAARVVQRLEGLSGKAGPAMAGAVVEKKQAAAWMSFGSLSSRYYWGNSRIAATTTFNGVATTNEQSLTDQSMLISSADISERYRSETQDNRLVFRDVNTRNFLAGQPSQNRVNAAYGEFKGREQSYLLRMGRQSATGGGVLGRFDGIAASYGDPQDVRVNGVAGSVVDYSPGSKPRFVGASMDRGAFSFYGIDQTVEGTLDRRALGAEYRYFDERKNLYGLLDYDTYFKAVNAAQFMGMSRGVGQWSDVTLNFMLDHRKTPSLSIRNALNGATTSSVSDLLQTMSVSSLRELALARTATSNMGQLGVTLPFRDKWQVGGDFRLTNTTGLPASGTPILPTVGTTTPAGYIPATPGRGLERSITGQVIGSGLYQQGDIWSGSLSYSSSGSVYGHTLFLYNHAPLKSGWLVDTSLQMSSYKDQLGGTTKQVMPMLRGSYRFREQFTFDADCAYQKIAYSGTQMNTDTRRISYSIGLRWDF